jgi:hypothetical protein
MHTSVVARGAAGAGHDAFHWWPPVRSSTMAASRGRGYSTSGRGPAVLLVAWGVVADVVVDHAAALTTRPTPALVHLHHNLSAKSAEKNITLPRFVGTAMTRTLILSHAPQQWLLLLPVPIPIGTQTSV